MRNTAMLTSRSSLCWRGRRRFRWARNRCGSGAAASPSPRAGSSTRAATCAASGSCCCWRSPISALPARCSAITTARPALGFRGGMRATGRKPSSIQPPPSTRLMPSSAPAATAEISPHPQGPTNPCARTSRAGVFVRFGCPLLPAARCLCGAAR